MNRVLVISSEFPPGPGGIGSHAYQLARHLTLRDWRVCVIAPQDYATPSDIDTFSSALSFRLVRVPSGRGRSKEALHRLRVGLRIGREFSPDVVVGTGLSGVWVAAGLAVVRRVPGVAVAHGSEFGRLGRAVGMINRWAFGRMNCVVAVSHFTKKLVEGAGIGRPKLMVIHNGADSSRFVMREDFLTVTSGFAEIPRGARVMLTVGNVSERKGQETVVRAMPLILREHPDVHYCMVGLPTQRDRLKSIGRELGVSDHLHFLGVCSPEQVVAWMNRCDLFVMTSKTTSNGDCEGFGIAVIEAALCGKPSVVSAQSGLTEAILEGVTGRSVDEANPEMTARAINELLANPGEMRRMGNAARDRAIREQTWESCAERFDSVLTGIARSRLG